MIPLISRQLRPVIILALAAVPASLFAAAEGSFVIPSNRAGNGTRFSYWQAYAPAGQISYSTPHFPNLLPTMGDSADPPNFSNWNTNIALYQIGTPFAFVLGAGHGIYSFREATKFKIAYTHTGADDVGSVVFQAKIAGSVPASSVELHYLPEGATEEVVLIPGYKALDNPNTAGFAEQILRAYEWDLTGKGVKDYTIYFATGSSSNPLYQVQTDTFVGLEFHQELGFVLSSRAYPFLRYGTPGRVEPDPDVVSETRFFKGGQEFPVIPDTNTGFTHVGWVDSKGAIADSTGPLTVSFPASNPTDLSVAGIFSPSSWAAYRDGYFNHEFTHGDGTQTDDSRDDTKSGPEVDLDGDGATNFYEYAFGGLPYTDDALTMVPKAGVVTVDGKNHAAITFKRRASTESDLAYVVEQSADLLTWTRSTEAAPLVELTNGPLEIDGTRTVTARSLTPVGPSSRYLRVKAEISAQ